MIALFAALEAPCSSRGCDIHNFRNYSVITCAARHVTNTSTEKGNAKGSPRRGVGGKRLGAQKPGTKDDDVRISKELSAFLLKIEIVGFVLALKSLLKNTSSQFKHRQSACLKPPVWSGSISTWLRPHGRPISS